MLRHLMTATECGSDAAANDATLQRSDEPEQDAGDDSVRFQLFMS